MNSATTQWPDTSAHGFRLLIDRSGSVSEAVVCWIADHQPSSEIEERLVGLGFARPDPAQAWRRPLAGLGTRAIKAAFPEMVMREHARAALIWQADDATADTGLATPPSSASADSTADADDAKDPSRIVWMRAERIKSESQHQDVDGMFEVNVRNGDNQEYTVGVVPPAVLPGVIGHELAAQVLAEADAHPDGKSYENIDVALFDPAFSVDSNRDMADMSAYGRVLPRDGDDPPEDGVYGTWQEADLQANRRHVWSILSTVHAAVVDDDDDGGQQVAVPGVLVTNNVVGYIVTEKPWTSGAERLEWRRAPGATAHEVHGDLVDAEHPASIDQLTSGMGLPAGSVIYAPGALDAEDEADQLWTVRLGTAVDNRIDFYGTEEHEAIGNAVGWLASHPTSMPLIAVEDIPRLMSTEDYEGDDATLQVEAETQDKKTSARKPRAQRAATTTGRVLSDFGEKIGGARKDLARARARGWMRIDDIREWTDYEKLSLISKDKVWPTPNYQGLVAGGMSRQAALFIKYLRDDIKPPPADLAGIDRYVDVVGRLAERLRGVTSDRALVMAMAPYYLSEEGQTLSGFYESYRTSERRVRGFDVLRHLLNLNSNRLEARDRGTSDAIIFPGYIDRWLETRRLRDWPKAKERQSPRNATGDSRHVIRPQLVGVERVGPDERQGVDVTEDDFQTTFGFRAGEFGNWLTGADRQQSLNHAYDGLCDLARVLGIPKRAIALNGTLAIAFGARGRGGRAARAAAHYEPGRRVINLTKLAGAGSLAHEWAHALDHFLFDQAAVGGRGPASALSPFASHWALSNLGALPTHEALRPVYKALYAVMRVIKQRPQTLAAKRQTVTASADIIERNLLSWTQYIRRQYLSHCGMEEDAPPSVASTRIDNAIADYYAAETCNDMQAAGHRLLETVKSVVPASAWGNQNKKHMSHMILIYGPTHLPRNRALLARLNAVNNEDQQAVASVVGDASVETQYLLDAKRRDRGRNPYYSENWELFARAFEAMVYDRIVDHGQRSDYLVRGVGAQDQEMVRSAEYGSAYPHGDERAAINGALSQMIEHLPVELMQPDDEIEAEAQAEPVRRRVGGRPGF